MIPSQHYFNLYLEASKGESYLDKYYKTSMGYLNYLIQRSEKQIQLLTIITDNKPRRDIYEKRNFLRHVNIIEEYTEDYNNMLKTDQSVEDQKERLELVRYLKVMNDKFDIKKSEKAKFIKDMDDYIKKKEYDPYNLSSDEKADLENFKRLYQYELAVKDKFEIKSLERSTNYREYEMLQAMENPLYVEEIKKYITAESWAVYKQEEKDRDFTIQTNLENKKYDIGLRRYNDRQVKAKRRIMPEMPKNYRH